MAAKKGDGVKDFVAALGAKRACKYVESVNALCETLRAEKDGTKALQKRLLAALKMPPALTAAGWTAKGVLDCVLPYLDVRSGPDNNNFLVTRTRFSRFCARPPHRAAAMRLLARAASTTRSCCWIRRARWRSFWGGLCIDNASSSMRRWRPSWIRDGEHIV